VAMVMVANVVKMVTVNVSAVVCHCGGWLRCGHGFDGSGVRAVLMTTAATCWVYVVVVVCKCVCVWPTVA
jgi:hypothetical protein